MGPQCIGIQKTHAGLSSTHIQTHTHTHTHTHTVSVIVWSLRYYRFLSTGTCPPGESALCAREPLGVSKPLLCVEQVDCKSCSRYPIPPKFQFQYEFIFQDKLCVCDSQLSIPHSLQCSDTIRKGMLDLCVSQLGFKRGLCNECIWNQHFDRLIHVFFTHA